MFESNLWDLEAFKRQRDRFNVEVSYTPVDIVVKDESFEGYVDEIDKVVGRVAKTYCDIGERGGARIHEIRFNSIEEGQVVRGSLFAVIYVPSEAEDAVLDRIQEIKGYRPSKDLLTSVRNDLADVPENQPIRGAEPRATGEVTKILRKKLGNGGSE